jgi:ribose transport system ATP-binding protein
MTTTETRGGVALEVKQIVKTFPGTRALDGVDLEVRYGRTVALIGENGAGKSTLMKVLSGVHAPDGGSMTLDGEPFTPAGPKDAAEAGVVLIHQELSLLPNLTLAENIFIGRQPTRYGMVDRRAMNAHAAELLAQVGLRLAPDTPTATCSIAVQQLVEIAKALSQDPKVLVFDEPTATLGQEEVEILYGIADSLRSRGVGIVWITHRLEEIARVADEIVVLRDGARVGGWPTGDVPKSAMVEAMVGRAIENIYPDPVDPTDEVALEVVNLTRRGAFTDISFTLRRGEVLGIAGLVGSGRSELVNAISGAEPATSGSIRVRGREVDVRSPIDGVRHGMALIPEDRREAGLAQRITIADNIGLPKRGLLRGVVDNRGLAREVEKISRDVGLKGHLPELAQTLSGGNQQKVVIAKWLMLNPQIIIFDEPTRGIDVGAKAAIYSIIHELAKLGAAVIVVSSEMPEVLGLSNRVLVLSHGKQAGIVDRSEADEKSVMALAVA